MVAKGAWTRDFGRIMSEAMKAVSGRASGDHVSAIARRMMEAEQ